MRVSEIYLSIQGEGPRVGIPTVFVRFGGCNLRCPGWPCDTQHAIDPKFRKEWKEMTPDEVTSEIIRVIGSARNVCFTGGEPFLQKAEELDELIVNLSVIGSRLTIEAFSNGMLPYSWRARDRIKFVLDWKLPGSGSSKNLSTREGQVRERNLSYFVSSKDVIKFTIADRVDYEYAKEIYRQNSLVRGHPIYYGVVWGKLDPAELIGWVLGDELDWRYTMQVHNVVWDRTQRGI